MDGDPVWLASISKRSVLDGKIQLVPSWPAGVRQTAEEHLLAALRGAGNPARERLFRMNVTLCVHRALSDEEVARLPASFNRADAAGLAGGPVEVLRENVVGSPSTKPCRNPRWQPIPGMELVRGAVLPLDCGACPPCLARATLE